MCLTNQKKIKVRSLFGWCIGYKQNDVMKHNEAGAYQGTYIPGKTYVDIADYNLCDLSGVEYHTGFHVFKHLTDAYRWASYDIRKLLLVLFKKSDILCTGEQYIANVIVIKSMKISRLSKFLTWCKH